MYTLWLAFLVAGAVTTAAPLGNIAIRDVQQIDPNSPLEFDDGGINPLGEFKIEGRGLELASKAGQVSGTELIFGKRMAPILSQRHGVSRKRRQPEQDNVEDNAKESMSNSEGHRVTRHIPGLPQEHVPDKLHGEINFLLCGKRSCPNEDANIRNTLLRHKRTPSWQKHADMLSLMYTGGGKVRARKGVKIAKRSVYLVVERGPPHVQ